MTDTAMKVCLAVDLGAGSGRVMAGRYDGASLELREVHRFPSASYTKDGHSHWDIRAIFASIKEGIKMALAEYGEAVVSIGVDSWGVDYGLLGFKDQLLGDPYQYRDARTRGWMERAFASVPREDIYAATGIQFLEFNTLYQLLAEETSTQQAIRLLMIPDLINHWLCGRAVNEHTNASTTQMVNAATGKWDADLLLKIDPEFPVHLLGGITEPGTVLGPLRPELQRELGAGPVPVIAVGSHDTASAVAGVPAAEAVPVFLSSGTWSLLGRELPAPVLTPEACAAGFSNEAGVAGTTRFLKNITGMWLLQECERVWKERDPGFSLDYAELLAAAEREPAFTALIDPDAPQFHAPDDMPAAIAAACRATGQPAPETPARFARVILESLAVRCRDRLRQLEQLTGQPASVINIVGGGSRNALLNQMIADATGRPVHAGPVEATAAGNILMQLIGLGEIAGLAEGRALLRRTMRPEVFGPRHPGVWKGVQTPGCQPFGS